MPEPDYVATLAGQLATRHPDLLSAEKDLAILRSRLALVATWINNTTYDRTAREALARDLHLPAPAPEK